MSHFGRALQSTHLDILKPGSGPPPPLDPLRRPYQLPPSPEHEHYLCSLDFAHESFDMEGLDGHWDEIPPFRKS